MIVGEGKGLEHVLNSQETPLKQIEHSKKTAANSNERSRHPERDRWRNNNPKLRRSFCFSEIERGALDTDGVTVPGVVLQAGTAVLECF